MNRNTIIALIVLLALSASEAKNGPCSQQNCGAGKCCDDANLGGVCYSNDNYDCVSDNNGKLTLCGKGLFACSNVCFDGSKYKCENAKLVSGATVSTPKPATPAPQPATTPKPATPTPSSVQTPAPTPKPTPTSGNPGNVPCGNGNCGAGNGCCGVQCFNPLQYSCPVDYVTKVGHLCPLGFSSCGGKCYDPKNYHCDGKDLAQGAENKAPASATNATPAPSAVNPNPIPVPTPPKITTPQTTQTADLRIINNCKSTLWFEARYGNFGKSLPGQASTHTRAFPGESVDYVIPAEGLEGTRFWAKYGCDNTGKNCIIGDQMQYYPEGGCPAGGCTPPVDSLFEATWGCKPGSSCHARNPTTWFDTSQVDGWTIPYKLTANGATNGCDCIGTKCGFSGVDASRLDLARCPTNENMAYGGVANAMVAGKQTSLSSVDLRIIDPKTNSIIGCMSPCKKINWGLPFGMAQNEGTKPALYMCCPTPDPKNCNPNNGCILPTDCRNGPIEQTKFVKAVHDMAPGIYSYSYDDGVGLHACPAGTVTYTMEYCPQGSSQYPHPL